MKYALIFLFFFPFMGLYAQKPRTLDKKEDREYFYDKLEKLFSTKLSFLKAKVNRNAKDYCTF
jgi:hypothetical protein